MIKRYLVLLFTCLAVIIQPINVSAAQKFVLDGDHTYALWHINHSGFSSQSGKWYTKGFLLLDKDAPQKSKVEATIEVANITTGLPELDKHLKGKLFFDVEHYPTATFVSDKVDVINKSSAKVYGQLTLHGATKPIVLNVTFNKAGINPISDKQTVGFTASAMIKRSDFGMNTLLPSVGDEVSLEIAAEAYQASPEDKR